MRIQASILFLASILNSPAVAEYKEPPRHRLLPIPIFITEPAVGEGLGIALTVFHSEPDAGGDHHADSAIPATREYEPPPIVSVLFGAKTNNGTYALGIGHANHWRRDSIRYSGYVTTANVVSQFYAQDQPLDFELDGNLIAQELKFRFGRSRWFLGPAISWLNANNTFANDNSSQGDIPESLNQFSIRNAGIAVRGLLDSRDNTTMPNRGTRVTMGLWRFDQSLGGQFDYWRTELDANLFYRLSPKTVLGFRFGIAAVDGEPPFFDFPSVKLRGIPALRYQADVAGALEAEGRFEFRPRWNATVFAGRGFTSDDEPFTSSEESIWTIGTGVRYQLFPAENIWFGIDVARGPEQWAFYIKINHGW